MTEPPERARTPEEELLHSFHRLGLYRKEGRILLHLLKRGTPLMLTDLAHGTGINKGEVSNYVSDRRRLRKWGLVRKEREPRVEGQKGRTRIFLSLAVDVTELAERLKVHRLDELTSQVDEVSAAAALAIRRMTQVVATREVRRKKGQREE